MKKTTTLPKLKPRRCRYCKIEFVPVPKNLQQVANCERKKFCSEEHRKAYFRYGGMNLERLTESLRKVLMRDAEFKTWVQELVRMEFHEMEEASEARRYSIKVKELPEGSITVLPADHGIGEGLKISMRNY